MEILINARGHSNVRSMHKTTLEVTREAHLTPRGDCIIAVSGDKAMPQLPEEFKARLRDDSAVLEINIECNGIRDVVRAHGSKHLILTHPTDLVVRKSDFIDDRTLAIKADKSARDLDRRLVQELKKDAPVEITLRLSSGGVQPP
jgi:hypothetical protein